MVVVVAEEAVEGTVMVHHQVHASTGPAKGPRREASSRCESGYSDPLCLQNEYTNTEVKGHARLTYAPQNVFSTVRR